MAHAVDLHVGKRLRHRRWDIGMTQGELADAIGIRFQQVQKYEAGTNRISASRLWDIAQAMQVPVEFFFDGLQATFPTEQQCAHNGSDANGTLSSLQDPPAMHDVARVG